MAIKSLLKKYKDYETKELARRIEKKKKLASYKELENKAKIKIGLDTIKKPVGSFNKTRYTKAIGNPYSVKFPKTKKTLKKIKNKKIRKKRKFVKKIVIYK